MLENLTKTQRKISIAILILIDIGISLFLIIYWFFLRRPLPPEKGMEKILQQLTAPQEAEIPEEIIEGLSAPKGETGDIEDIKEILKELTSPE